MPGCVKRKTVTRESLPPKHEKSKSCRGGKGTDPTMVVYTVMVEYVMVIVLLTFAVSLFGLTFKDAVYRAFHNISAAMR